MKERWSHFFIIWATLLVLGVASCNGEAIPASPTVGKTPSPLPESTLTPTPVEESANPCGYTWARKTLPDVGSQVGDAFRTAGISNAEIWAEAYGESCIDAKTGQVQSFSTMETDFHVRLTVSSLDDSQTMGELLEKTLGVLDGFPPGKVPGPQPGYIGVEFDAGQNVLNLWFQATQGVEARQQGLHGTALLEALKNK